MLLRFSHGQGGVFSDITIQPFEPACSALSSFVTLGQLNRPRNLPLKNRVTLQLAGGAEGSKSRDLFSWGSLLCERKVMHGKFQQQRKSPLHTQKEPVFGNV